MEETKFGIAKEDSQYRVAFAPTGEKAWRLYWEDLQRSQEQLEKLVEAHIVDEPEAGTFCLASEASGHSFAKTTLTRLQSWQCADSSHLLSYRLWLSTTT